MTRLVIAVVIIVVVALVAQVARRRRTPDAPTQRNYHVPEQIDRADFERPDAPWLIAVFTSDVCDKCAEVWSKVQVLESDEVAVAQAEYVEHGAIHEKYRIDAVPTAIVVDADGVTRRSFLGPMSATDLWAAVAEAREPGSTPSA
ncbi:MAG: hypothetical protein AAGG08_10275 [Actinomycetota bacterium]